jgi:hypothetical protein
VIFGVRAGGELAGVAGMFLAVVPVNRRPLQWPPKLEGRRSGYDRSFVAGDNRPRQFCPPLGPRTLLREGKAPWPTFQTQRITDLIALSQGFGAQSDREEDSSMIRTTLITGVSMAILWTISASHAGATPQLFTDAKQAGMPAQNCQYCHVSKMPKKEGFKPDDLNERGKWLLSERDKQAAKDIKADWLKSYPGGKEQK